MKSTSERPQPTQAHLTVEVPFEELTPAMNKVYKSLSEQVSVPGFRRGHVPQKIIDQRIGRAYVIEQAINDKLGEFYAKAIEENNIIPMDSPEIDVTETPNVTGKQGGQLVFTADVACQPEFDLPDISSKTIEVDALNVSMDDVEEELTQLRDRFSSLIGVDRAVEEGDYVSIDLEATKDGEQIDSSAGVSYQQGSGGMLPGLDEALIGMNEGDTTSFDTEFVGGEHAGEKGQACVTVKAVKVKELPEADDDFAMMASEFDTIGELRADLRTNLEQRHQQRQIGEAVDKLRDHIIDSVDIELPQSVIDKQLKNIPDDADEDQKQSQEEAIRTSLKADIVMDKIGRESDARLEENELLEAIMQLSQMYRMEPQQLLQSQEQVAGIAAQLTQNKALTLLLEQVEVKDTEGHSVDVSEAVEAARPRKADQEAENSDDPVDTDDLDSGDMTESATDHLDTDKG